MMAEGCINTHMARLLGAPPLLDTNITSGLVTVNNIYCITSTRDIINYWPSRPLVILSLISTITSVQVLGPS